MLRARVLLALCLAASCEENHDDATEPLVLRVGTHFGLANIEPDSLGTSASSLEPLVFRPLREQFSDLRVEGTTVVLTPKPGAASNQIKHPALKTVRADASRVTLELSDAERAKGMSLETHLLDTGPYEQESLEGDLLRLRRRHGEGPVAIEVVNVASEEEEWRRFLARDVDVLPFVSPRHLAQLADVPSVRLLEMKKPATAGMHFRIRDGSPLADPRLRRAISLGIRRGALAEVITGRRELAEKIDENLEEARRLTAELGISPSAPVKLRTILHDAASDYARAALVLEQQLAVIGVELEIETLTLENLVGRIRSPDWEILLFFGGFDERYYYWVRSGDMGNIGGYSSPELDAAIAAGDHAKARAILVRDVPFTPLYRIQDGAAIDRELCGDPPESAGHFYWLASVHRCAPGEGE